MSRGQKVVTCLVANCYNIVARHGEMLSLIRDKQNAVFVNIVNCYILYTKARKGPGT